MTLEKEVKQMRLVEIDTSQYSPSNIGFASSLVAKACRYTGTDINIRTDEDTWVNLKSIMGVLTLNYSKAQKISLQIMGEDEEGVSRDFIKFIKTNLEIFSK